MKIINHNSVNGLYDRVEKMAHEPHESWRCVYFRNPYKLERHNKELYTNFVVNPITTLLDSTAGYIYLLDDGDIFALFQGGFKIVMEKLTSHFGDLSPDQIPGEVSEGLFSIFDLSKHWNAFYNLCESKYLGNLVSEEARQHYLATHVRPMPTGSTQQAM